MNRRSCSILADAAVMAGVSLVRAQSESKTILGKSVAFTGLAAQVGIQFHKGAMLYFNKVNAQGGVDKRLIEIRTLNDC